MKEFWSWRAAVNAWKEVFTWKNIIGALILSAVSGIVSYFTGYSVENVIAAITIGYATLVLLLVLLSTLLGYLIEKIQRREKEMQDKA